LTREKLREFLKADRLKKSSAFIFFFRLLCTYWSQYCWCR